MDSRELGLVLARHLLDVEDLHYGWWAEGEAPSLAALPAAQRRHSEVLLAAVALMLPAHEAAPRVLDVGCGTGALAAMANERGWACDGLVPSAPLAERARAKLAAWPQRQVFECRLEDAAGRVPGGTYGVAYFSESFQYIDLDAGLGALASLLEPGGAVVVFDFFERDDAPAGKAPIGGGHRLSKALAAFQRHGFELMDDVDHSRHAAPNLDLLQNLLRHRLRPAATALDAYLAHRHGLLWRVLKWTQRRSLAKLARRWGESRDAAAFLRWKTYRLLCFRRGTAQSGGPARTLDPP